jgi:hypothetical protein
MVEARHVEYFGEKVFVAKFVGGSRRVLSDELIGQSSKLEGEKSVRSGFSLTPHPALTFHFSRL